MLVSTINNFRFFCRLTIALSLPPPSPGSGKRSIFLNIVLQMMTVKVGPSVTRRTGSILFLCCLIFNPYSPLIWQPLHHMTASAYPYHSRSGLPCFPFSIGPCQPICYAFCCISICRPVTHPVLRLQHCALGLDPLHYKELTTVHCTKYLLMHACISLSLLVLLLQCQPRWIMFDTSALMIRDGHTIHHLAEQICHGLDHNQCIQRHISLFRQVIFFHNMVGGWTN